jgi:homocysteine S-methyltransferase
VVGVNCAVGPAPMLDTIERMEAVTRLKLSAQPNAGKPRDVEGRNIYLCSPEYMASYARRFILHRVRIVGGCCGTTPEHIRQIKTAVRSVAPAVLRQTGAGVRRPVISRQSAVVDVVDPGRRLSSLASRSRGCRRRWPAARS